MYANQNYFSFLQLAKAIPLFLLTKFQMKSNHYEMKLHLCYEITPTSLYLSSSFVLFSS